MTQRNRLSADQVAAYRRDGYLILSGLFRAEEIERMKSEFDRVLADPSRVDEANLRAYTRGSLDGGILIDRLDPVRDLSECFDRLSRDERIVGPARELVGEDVLLLKDKIIAKFPGALGYSLHQDFAYWEAAGLPWQSMATAFISVDPATAENGAIEFVLGYHDRQFNRPGVIEDIDERNLDMSRAKLAVTEPGDLVFFHPLVPHRSGPNRSRISRRYLYFTYSAARHGDCYERYYETFRNRRRGELPAEIRERSYFR